MLKKFLAKARQRDPVESYHAYHARKEAPPPALCAKMGELELQVGNRAAAVTYYLEAVDGYLARENGTMAQESLAGAVRAQGHLTPPMLLRRVRLAVFAEDWAETIRQVGHARRIVSPRSMSLIEDLTRSVEDAPFVPAPVMAALGEFLQYVRRGDDAIRCWTTAMELATARGERDLADELRRRLELATSEDQGRQAQMEAFLSAEKETAPKEMSSRTVPLEALAEMVAQPREHAEPEVKSRISSDVPTVVESNGRDSAPPRIQEGDLALTDSPEIIGGVQEDYLPAKGREDEEEEEEQQAPEPVKRVAPGNRAPVFLEEDIPRRQTEEEITAAAVAEVQAEMDAIARSLGPLDVAGLIAALPSAPASPGASAPVASGRRPISIPVPNPLPEPNVQDPPHLNDEGKRAVLPSANGAGTPESKGKATPPPAPLPSFRPKAKPTSTKSKAPEESPASPEIPRPKAAATQQDVTTVQRQKVDTPAPREVPEHLTLSLPLRTVAPGDDDETTLTRLTGAVREALADQADSVDVATHYELGVMFLGMGLYKEAIDELRRSLRAPAYRGKSSEYLVRCYLMSGDARAALVAGRLIIEDVSAELTAEERCALQYWVARAGEEMGDLQQAMGSYRQVVQDNPGFADAAKRYLEIEGRLKAAP